VLEIIVVLNGYSFPLKAQLGCDAVLGLLPHQRFFFFALTASSACDPNRMGSDSLGEQSRWLNRFGRQSEVDQSRTTCIIYHNVRGLDSSMEQTC